MQKLLLISSLLISFQIQASVKCGSGVKFDDNVTIQDDNKNDVDLELNGVGLKKVLFFNAFYAALYLENTTSNADKIIASDEHKVAIVHILRNVDRQQLVNMFDDEYKRLCADKCAEMKPYHEQFISYIRDVAKNERIYLINFENRFEVEYNMNETFQPIYSPDYARLLQNSLFGPDAQDKKLKKGILGQDKVCK